MRKEWVTKKLEEVCEMYQPKTISKSKMISDGKYPVFGANGIIGRYNKFNHEDSELLVTCRGATCGSINISLPKSWINGNAMVIKPKTANLHREFLTYFFRGGFDFSEIISGSAQPQITRQSLNPVEVPIPSLAEQREIVILLDKAFVAIDQARANIEKNIENAKELFRSKLNEIFSQKGAGWEERPLGEACVISMGQSPKGTSYNFEGIGMPLINGPVEFGPNPFSKTEMTKWTTEPTKTCREGDLILCVRGSTTGRINIAGFEACIGRGVALIRYSENQEWLNYFIRHYQKSIYDLGTGATFPNVSGKMLSEITFPEPPIETQNRLIEIMEDLLKKNEQLIQSYNRKYELLEELRKSLLQKAFSGELTQKEVRYEY